MLILIPWMRLHRLLRMNSLAVIKRRRLLRRRRVMHVLALQRKMLMMLLRWPEGMVVGVRHRRGVTLRVLLVRVLLMRLLLRLRVRVVVRCWGLVQLRMLLVLVHPLFMSSRLAILGRAAYGSTCTNRIPLLLCPLNTQRIHCLIARFMLFHTTFC